MEVKTLGDDMEDIKDVIKEPPSPKEVLSEVKSEVEDDFTFVAVPEGVLQFAGNNAATSQGCDVITRTEHNKEELSYMNGLPAKVKNSDLDIDVKNETSTLCYLEKPKENVVNIKTEIKEEPILFECASHEVTFDQNSSTIDVYPQNQTKSSAVGVDWSVEESTQPPRLCYSSATQLQQQNRKHVCETCGKGFRTLWHLREHSLSHRDARPFKCDYCEKTYKRVYHLRAHLVTHDDNRPHQCQICGKAFKQLPGLRTHLLTHDDTRLHKCGICDSSFKQLSTLRTHALIHDNKRKHTCHVCHKSFRHLSYFKAHLLIHAKDKVYKCTICDKSFKQSPYLRKHLLRHDAKEYKCDNCNKTFKELTSLRKHFLKHL